jgi:hypothetical protein
MLKKIATAAFATFLISQSAFAFPFHPRPDAFASYLNSKSFQDGRKRSFSGLRGCREYNDAYICGSGYVQIYDPIRGNIFCELQQNSGVPGAAVYFVKVDGQVYIGDAGPCRRS